MDEDNSTVTENQEDGEEETEKPEEKELTLEDYMSKIDVIKCPGCKYDSSTANVRLHLKRLHLDKKFCNICNKDINERRDDHCAKHLLMAILSNLKEQCSECSEFFMLDTKNSEDSEFKCKACAGESSNTETPTTDSELKYLHRCDTCFQRFAHRRTLTRHVQNFHGDSEFYQCKICKKTFHRRRHLVVHRRTHNKPFMCKICSAAFFGRNKLEQHIKCYHPLPEFECSSCKKQFKSKSAFEDHKPCSENASEN